MSGGARLIRVVDLIRLVSAALVIVLVGRAIVNEQREAMEACLPECDVLGIAAIQLDAMRAVFVAFASYSVGPAPVGMVALGFVCLWLVRFAHYGPVIR